MARTNPSLAEALSPWSAPHDAAELLEGFRLSINALADEQHTGWGCGHFLGDNHAAIPWL